MTKIPKEITAELLNAMDTYTGLAKELIDKLISETDQPGKEKIKTGHYYEIENAELLNGEENLSGNWSFWVHGEHCKFENTETGQTLEVSLGNQDRIKNLDPYFFYNFLNTTENFNHLTKYFNDPFRDTCNFFEAFEDKGVLIHVDGLEWRKLNTKKIN